MKNEIKQTAVEWLFETVCNNDWKHLPGEIKLQIFEQAKEMEKQQIISDNIADMEFIPVDPNRYQEDAENYYNETYGGNK